MLFLNFRMLVGHPNLSSWVRSESTWKAEILWTMKIIILTNPVTTTPNYLHICFPTAKSPNLMLAVRKKNYLVNHGLAPYFREKLTDKIKDLQHFVILFDKSLNDMLQSKQMDMHVRFMDMSKERVLTCYLDSAFMRHGRASDCIEHFNHLTSKLNLEKLIQISMDGPNVNLKFLRDFQTNVLSDVTTKKY